MPYEVEVFHIHLSIRMRVTIRPGKYVIAVSGGVDSVSLLHALRTEPGVELVVAHFDHGIRPDSTLDRTLVRDLTRGYGLTFVCGEGHLGVAASEAVAREARYSFLRRVEQSTGARAIITAHHQDDVLETAILNLLRGTGRRGLTALSDRPGLVRPLLEIPKREIIEYATKQGLRWQEDSTNQDERYQRNYVRRHLLPRFDEQARAQLVRLLSRLQATNAELDSALSTQLHLQPQAGQIDRAWFNSLPHGVARELMAAWLRAHNEGSFDSKRLERLVVAAKVSRAGKRVDVSNGAVLLVFRDRLALDTVER